MGACLKEGEHGHVRFSCPRRRAHEKILRCLERRVVHLEHPTKITPDPNNGGGQTRQDQRSGKPSPLKRETVTNGMEKNPPNTTTTIPFFPRRRQKPKPMGLLARPTTHLRELYARRSRGRERGVSTPTIKPQCRSALNRVTARADDYPEPHRWSSLLRVAPRTAVQRLRCATVGGGASATAT